MPTRRTEVYLYSFFNEVKNIPMQKLLVSVIVLWHWHNCVRLLAWIVITVILFLTPPLPLLGFESRSVKPVEIHYPDWAIPAHLRMEKVYKIHIKFMEGINPRQNMHTAQTWGQRKIYLIFINVFINTSPNNMRVIKSRRMRWAGQVERVGEERGVCRVLVGKREVKRPLGRPRRRWVDNIRMDLQEVGCGYMDWIGLAQDRDRWRTLVSVVMNLRVPWNAGNFLTSCKPVSFSKRTLHRGVSKYRTEHQTWSK